MEALREGREPPPPADGLARQCVSLLASGLADPDLFRAMLEYSGTLTPIQEIVRRPEVAQRLAAARQALRDAPPPRPPGPDRGQLLALLA